MARKYLVPIDLSKQELQNARIQNLSSAPSSPVAGQIYYNTSDNALYFYNGTSWVNASSSSFTVAGDSGSSQTIASGDTLTISGGTGLTAVAGATDTVTLNLDSTAVTAGSYGGTSSIPTFTVDAQGRLTAAGSATPDLTLGTHTSGNYVASLVAGTGVSLANNTGEGATPTVSIGQAVGTSDNVSFADISGSGDLTIDGVMNIGLGTGTSYVDGNLTVTGTTTGAFTGNVTGNVSGSAGTVDSLTGHDTDDLTEGTTNLYYTDARVDSEIDSYLSGGTGVSVSSGTISIGQAVGTGSSPTFANLTLSGNLTVNGTTTTINSTALSVDDINITLGDTASPTDTTANGGGITLKGTTDHTITYNKNGNGSWDSSEDINVASGKQFLVDGTSVLTGSTLGSGVTASSLTSVGTITTGTWNGTTIAVANGGTGSTTASGARSNLGATGKYATSVGDGSATSFTVTHSLGSLDVIVQVYTNSDGTQVEADVTRATTNTVTVAFASAPTSNQYRVVVIG